MRRCSRTACLAPAVATLTFVYADSLVVLGPLAARREPGAYDLCTRHAESTSAPRGWEIIRLPHQELVASEHTESDDIMALAEAVRQIGLRQDDPVAVSGSAPRQDGVCPQPRLRLIRD